MASSPKIDDLKKKFEENPRRYFAPLANEYRKVGEIEQAIAICKEYLPQQPGHMSGHIVFGQALFEAKQMDEAKTVFETALSLDPENLIALKHLGDIALKAGDLEGAKGWYKRVLEADPRNEEAQVQMKRLEGGEKAAGPTTVLPAVATPVVSLSTQPTQPVPSAKALAGASAPTVVMAAFKPGAKAEAKPAAPTPVSSPAIPAPKAPAAAAPAATPPAPAPPATTAASPTAEIRLEGMTSMEPPGTKAGTGQAAPAQVEIIDTQSAPPATPVAPTVGLETTAIASAEAPAMDSFTLEGLETTSMSPAAPPPAAPPAAPTPVAPAPPAPIAEINLDFAPPAAPPAPPPPAAPAPAIDLDFAPPPAPPTPTPTAPPPAAAPPVIELDLPSPAGGEPGLVDLNVDLPPVAPPAPPPAPVAATPVPEPPAPAVAELPPVETPPLAEEPFVTETMAELYLHQGHRDEALRVYRALLAQKPGDAGLQAKIASLEAPPAPTMHAGPTIRSMLLLIAERRPGHRPGQNGSAPAMEAAHEAPAAPAPRSADASQGPPSRLSADTLALLWNHAPPQPAEENAAVMLAMAFADLVGMDASAPPAATAAPATAAGSVAPPSSFSFDKFFNQRVTTEHATPVAAAAPVESQEDVAKFTRWLEGLKQQ